jgi:hypothetical protein
MSALGQKQTCAPKKLMSALDLRADTMEPIFKTREAWWSTGGSQRANISRRHRPECGNGGLGRVALFVDLQVGWRDVGKDAAQRVQPTRLTGCKATHRTSLTAVIKTITECTTTNN